MENAFLIKNSMNRLTEDWKQHERKLVNWKTYLKKLHRMRQRDEK